MLAKDVRQQQFIRRYLYRLGYTRHQMDFKSLPEGSGSGEHWVRQHYANCVRDYRVRFARAKTSFVVAIDADTGDVSQRLRQFQIALEQEGLAPRANDEAVIHLIPRRNIETWILCLSGIAVDEETDYRHNNVDERILPATAAFYEWTRPNARVPGYCVPPLKAAISEIRRLL